MLLPGFAASSWLDPPTGSLRFAAVLTKKRDHLMAQHLYMPDSNDFWYGEFADSPLHQNTLADELFKVFCSTFIHVAGDDHHLWVHGVAYSMEWTWCVCPALVDIPNVGPALHLRGVSEPSEWEHEFSDWMAENRRWFGQSLAHKLMLPVLVSDDLDHIDMACRRPGFEDAAGYPPVDMVVSRTVSDAFAIVMQALNPSLSLEEARDYALALSVHHDVGGGRGSYPEPPRRA